MTKLLYIAAILSLLALVLASPGLAGQAKQNCFLVGGFPAAQSREDLTAALDLLAKGKQDAYQQMRDSGKISLPHATKSEETSFEDGGLAKVKIFKKVYWIEQKALQCR